MKVDVDFDAEEVTRQLSEAIMESAIGAQIKTQIDDYISKFGDVYKFKDAVNKTIDDKVKDCITNYINIPENHEAIKKVVLEKLTEENINKRVGEITEKLFRSY